MANLAGGSIVWDLDIDKKKFSSALSSAKAEASEAAKGIQGSVGSITSAMEKAAPASQAFAGALLAVGASLVGAAGFGIKIAGDLEAARQGFVALLGSATEADEVMARIKKEAASTPFELTGLVAGAQALTAVTKDGQKAIDTLLDVGKAIATSGKGQAELDRVILNLQQISSTGKVTAMDIRQFQSAIPMFNDILKASGLTADELQNSSDAAGLLFEAFRKAGEQGGITSKGFEAQAGTWKQLWSNLVDTVTIGASDLVIKLGLFDKAKDAIASLSGILVSLTTPESIEKIKDFFTFMADIAPILAGAIIGALAPAVGAMIAFWIPLLPFIAVGAAIGAVVWLIIKAFRALGPAIEFVKGIVDVFIEGVKAVFNVFKEVVFMVLTLIGEKIRQEAAPYIWLYYNIIEPIMLLIIAIVAQMADAVMQHIGNMTAWVMDNVVNKWLVPLKNNIVMIFNQIKDTAKFAWEGIRMNIINPITEAVAKVTSKAREVKSLLDETWRNIVDMFKGFGGAIINAITKPFIDAKNKIESIARQIRDAANEINPFTRHSPSLVDNVIKGIGIIKDEYASLGQISLPPVTSQIQSLGAVSAPLDQEVGGSGGKGQVAVNIDTVNVTDESDIESIGREIGFRVAIAPRYSL